MSILKKLKRTFVQYSGSWNGRYSASPTGGTQESKGTWQPVTGDDLKLLDSGLRTHKTYKFFTKDYYDFEEKDTFWVTDYDGKSWRIVQRKSWKNNVINHYMYLLQEENVNE